MSGTFWPIVQDYNKLYKMTAWYIGPLHAEEMLEILRCRIHIMDRIVHGKLEQLMKGQ